MGLHTALLIKLCLILQLVMIKRRVNCKAYSMYIMKIMGGAMHIHLLTGGAACKALIL